MQISVTFYSYFKELAGCARASLTLAPGATLGDLYEQVLAAFPRLGPLRNSTLMAVGVEYQDRGYALQDGDEVSLFPPVQGG
jgi:molybdopterin converting factor small subunit